MESVGFANQNEATNTEYHKNDLSKDDSSVCFKKVDLNIYNILNFLQSEWTKISVERSQWEYEKAELQTKISVLQNEKIGNENLKNDLVRRIKMLEYALKQERFKNFTLKYPTETVEDTNVSDNLSENIGRPGGLSTLERARLREYLMRIGMGKLSTELRITKVKELLGISPRHDGPDFEKFESALSEFSFLPESQDEAAASSENSSKEVSQQCDETASALSEFDNLVAQQAPDEGTSEVDFLVDAVTSGVMEPSSSWASGDQCALVDRLKEHYRLGLPINRSAQPHQTNSSTSVEVPMPPDTYDEMELFSSHGRRFQNVVTHPRTLPEEVLLVAGGGEGGGGLGDLASLTSASALDNLDGVVQAQQLHHTVEGGDDATGDVVITPASKAPPAWVAKYSLRSHFDAIRAVTFHHSDQIVLTGSEDCTLRLWSLAKRVQAKKSSCLDVEPMYTCRGHTSPVLCVALLSVSPSASDVSIDSSNSSPLDATLESNFAFSGSLDGEIRSWRFGGLQLMLYENFDSSVSGPLLKGHSDAVWSLAVRADGSVLSASADGTVQLWNAFPALLQQPQPFCKDTNVLSAVRVFRPISSGGVAVPTSVVFLPNESNLSADDSFAVGLTSGDVCIIQLETKRQVHRFEPTHSKSADVTEPPGSVNALCVHPSQPLLIAAHENRQIRFLDTTQGTCLHCMVAHLEGVTSLAIDPRGIYLLSASHDSSIRLWDIESRTCVQEFTSHRKKYDESIHSVAFHPSRPLIASAGADGLAKVYV
uniref:WD_REPEATS_REGION domain-containing protein n=2 Tax=Mesocestoides corti TaxID=53468 RepID=A0A5K3FFL1_MESCO